MADLEDDQLINKKQIPLEIHKDLQEDSLLLKQQDSYTPFGEYFEDSVLKQDLGQATNNGMVNVEHSLANISRFSAKPLSMDREGFELQLTRLKSMYSDLVSQCHVYRNLYRNTSKTGPARQRYLMVSRLLARAMAQARRLERKAWLYYDSLQQAQNQNAKASQTPPRWSDIMAELDAASIDISDQPGLIVTSTEDLIGPVQKLSYTDSKHTTPIVGYIHDDVVNSPLSTTQQGQTSYATAVNQDFITKHISNNKALSAKERTQASGYVYFMASVFSTENFQESILRSLDTADLNKQETKDNVLNYISTYYNPALAEKFLGQKYSQVLTSPLFKEILADYLPYISKHLLSYNLAHQQTGIAEDANITVRNIAAYRMSKLMGVSEIIPAARRIRYKDKSGNHRGVLVAEAKGIDMETSRTKVNAYSPQAMLQLNSLQILDVVFGLTTRSRKGIKIEYDENNTATAIKGIDNAFCMGQLTFAETIDQSTSGSSIVNEKNECSLNHVDSRLYYNIVNLSDQTIQVELAGLIKDNEMKALLNRFHQVKALLRNNRSKPGFLVRPGDINSPDAASFKAQPHSYIDFCDNSES